MKHPELPPGLEEREQGFPMGGLRSAGSGPASEFLLGLIYFALPLIQPHFIPSQPSVFVVLTCFRLL